MMKNVWRQKCQIIRKIRDPLYTTFQKIFTIIRIFLKSEAPKALYSSHSFIVSALINLKLPKTQKAARCALLGCVRCVMRCAIYNNLQFAHGIHEVVSDSLPDGGDGVVLGEREMLLDALRDVAC